jgi:L-ribulose-5-phosphate 3-epimerase
VISKLGVMQGRLLPKYNGLYQAHPKGYWQKEFFIAKDFSLDCIEFILDFKDFAENPLMHNDGLKEISSISNKTGIEVHSICADYFMEEPLHGSIEKNVEKSISVLTNLISNASLLGIKDIVIPCVDHSTLQVKGGKERFIDVISQVTNFVEKKKINLSLETDLPPDEFTKLLEKINSNFVTVNYDIGNSASLGYNPLEELDAYGEKISDIHIKDRLLGSKSVFLGNGDANFAAFFSALEKLNYQGIFIMQAYRDNEGLKVFKNQLDWFLSAKFINN